VVIYISRDSDPVGGYFHAEDRKPDMTIARRTITEVREVEGFPDDVWPFVLVGGLPVDSDGSNDSTWAAWWPEGRTVWIRE
jgi:hypothetical protein